MDRTSADQPRSAFWRAAATACCLAAAAIWAFFLATQQFRPFTYWLLDWHVYTAGARDFLNQDLYHVQLVSPYRLPVDQFNYPTLSALAVLPLLPLPDSIGGTAWVILNLLAIAATGFLVARMLRAPRPAVWAAIAFLAYTLHPWMDLALLGNNTPLVLLFVAAFAHQHFGGRDRSAGTLLGIAIGMKLWPIALLPLLLRERRWESLQWVGYVTGATILVTLVWLGLDVIGPAISALQVRAAVDPWNPVLFVSWLRETFSWWPVWAGYLIAIVLMLIPAKGRMGVGLGILAGLAAIPNVWRTYAPTLVVALLFVVSDMRKEWRWPRVRPASAQADFGARLAGVEPPADRTSGG